MENLGSFVLLAIGVALVAGGLYGLAPLLLDARRRRAEESPYRIKEVSTMTDARDQRPDHDETNPTLAAGNEPDPGVVEELFAELFAIRASLAELTAEVRSLRPAASSTTEPSESRRTA
jgi:cell division septation protein DedD